MTNITFSNKAEGEEEQLFYSCSQKVRDHVTDGKLKPSKLSARSRVVELIRCSHHLATIPWGNFWNSGMENDFNADTTEGYSKIT